MADGHHHQVACDVLEEQGHWQLGAGGAPLLGARCDEMFTLVDDEGECEWQGDDGRPEYGEDRGALEWFSTGDGTGADDLVSRQNGNGGYPVIDTHRGAIVDAFHGI